MGDTIMAINVAWDNRDKTILTWTFIGRWTWDEFDAAVTETETALASGSPYIAVVADITRSSLIPADVLRRVRDRYVRTSPQIYLYIAVGADSFIELLWSTFTNLIAPQIHMRFVRTLDDAREYVSAHPPDSV
jgi:hypothetical protein